MGRRHEKKRAKQEAKNEERRAIENQYGLDPGRLNVTSKPGLIGRFVFLSKKQRQQTVNAIRFIPKPDAPGETFAPKKPDSAE